MKITSILASLAALATAKVCYVGVNESGGEFGVYSSTSQKGTGLPGRLGVEYAFINKSTIDIWVEKNKINLFRVAFLLERMCPVATGLGKKFNETHFSEFEDAINYITKTKGAYAILDPHNYMRYNDPSKQPTTGSIIGNTGDSKAATTAQFGDFWGELAARFKDNDKVIFGLMNEPHDMQINLIIQNEQAAINAIRKAGANQMILAPGNSYTGGHSWTTTSSDMSKLTDPAKNLAIDIHEYLDQDFSGSHKPCSQAGPSNLAGVTNWLKQNKLKAMITEFGGSANSQCASMLTDLLKYMASNDVYIGWTAWAAGPLWGTASPCCSDSAKDGSFEPNTKADGGKPGYYDTIWMPTIQPQVPASLKTSGISSVDACT